MNHRHRMPNGYRLLESFGEYGFVGPGINSVGFLTQLRAVDAAWQHLRDNATTVAAQPVEPTPLDAALFTAGCRFINEKVRQTMREAGYVVSNDHDARSIVLMLLEYLNGKKTPF